MNSLVTPNGVGYVNQPGFNPYEFNGGTILALAGEDYAIVASDTRLSEGFRIHSRDSPKAYRLTNKAVLVSTGFRGDVLTLTKLIDVRLKMYEHEHGVKMSISAIAGMMSTMLYYRRFFPYFTYNVLAGIDDEGKGAVYSFDPVGSYEREQCRAAGSAGSILQPLLDNQIGYKNQANKPAVVPPLAYNKAMELIRDVFVSAAERDIYTGDGLHVEVISADGINAQTLPLRKD